MSSQTVAMAEEGLSREEYEQYWREMPTELRDLVSPGGRISVDLLAFVVEDRNDRIRLLKDFGLSSGEAEVAEVFLQVLQLDAEHRVRRLQRQRIAKRGPEASLAMAMAAKVARREVPRALVPGELETVAWLEGRSGAIHQPRKKDMAMYGVGEEQATQRDLEKAKLRKEHQAFVRELQEHPELKLVKEAKRSQDPRWLDGIYGLKWPVEPYHVIDYLIDLRNTGAPRTVPQAFAAALGFMDLEKASGGNPGER